MIDVIDADNNKTTFLYDAAGNKTEEIDPNGASATFAYDTANQLTAVTDQDGRLMTFSYDGDGRETGETWYSGSSALSTMIVDVITFVYDAGGNLDTAANSAGTYTMAYNAVNEVTSVSEPVGVTLTMAYDNVGNRTGVTDSLGGVETSTYDPENRLLGETYSVGGTQIGIAQTFNALDQVTSLVRDYGTAIPAPAAAVANYTYDDEDRLTNLQDLNPSGANIDSYTYTYDAAGNLQSEVLTRTTMTAATTNYSYDADNQLLAAGPVTYTYDATGNRGTVDSSGTTTTYTVTTGNEVSNDGTSTYSYDAEGNETGRTTISGGDNWAFTYNNRNEMVTAVDKTSGGVTETYVTYVYDAFGNQIKTEVTPYTSGVAGTTVTTKFAMDGWDPALKNSTGNSKWNVLADVSGGGTLETRYLRGDVVDQIFAEVDYNGSSYTTYWDLTDIRGSVRTVVDNNGTVRDAVNYDAYGNVTAETTYNSSGVADGTANPAAYRGRYGWDGYDQDATTGLDYNHARYYDPHTGRWLSQDPLGFDAGDSNLYRYVKNQPTDEIDPSGRIVVTTLTKNPTIGPNGFRVEWMFKLSKPAEQDGYVVQKVTQNVVVDGKKVAIPSVYWEAWFVKKGQTLDTSFGPPPENYTDASWLNALPGRTGTFSQSGEIKFFFKCTHGVIASMVGLLGSPLSPIAGLVPGNTGTGNLGDIGANPVVPPDPSLGWKTQNPATWANDLPSTTTQPPWWNLSSDQGEPTGARSLKATWNHVAGAAGVFGVGLAPGIPSVSLFHPGTQLFGKIQVTP